MQCAAAQNHQRGTPPPQTGLRFNTNPQAANQGPVDPGLHVQPAPRLGHEQAGSQTT